MKKQLKKITDLLHICRFNTPIASQYCTFNTRRIIFECRCGKRELRNVSRAFGSPFPMETTMLITNEEMDKLLNQSK